MSLTPTVAIAADFLEAYAAIPRVQQRKVRGFISKFQADPTTASINYEAIHDVKDARVRTVRIDQAYRAVVLHPERGNVYLLAWVDHHDEAMAWARRKVFAVNPATGALQVLDMEEGPALAGAVAAAPGGAAVAHGLFTAFAPADLLQTGLPEPLLPAVMALRAEAELEALRPYLPVEAYEALWWVAQGMSVPQAMQEVAGGAQAPAGKVDPGDIDAALEHPDSKRRFVVVQSAQDLERMLDAPLAAWRVFLHPSQRSLVEKRFNGPARVTGGAGTGKTVVAMHRARYLAAEVFKAPADRVLFTTYTRNLAANIEGNLKALCGAEMARIEVVNLDRWAMGFLRGHGQAVAPAEDDVLAAAWRAALGAVEGRTLPEELIRGEWEQVVVAQDLVDRAAYLAASRRGQGRPLTRAQRSEVWEVIEAFRAELAKGGYTTWADLPNLARRLIEQRQPDLPYRAVVVDETQDLGLPRLRLLRALLPPGPDDLFLVGDARQRIYGQPVALSHAGIDVRGRASMLKINYRTTEEIRRWAMRVLSGETFDDLDEGQDSPAGYRSLLSGPAPMVRGFGGEDEEITWLAAQIDDLLQGGVAPESICVVACGRKQVARYQHGLERLDVATLLLDGRADDAGEGVRLATMYRVKGLEFAHVFLAGANAAALPAAAPGGDPLESLRLRCLVHVAATRARDTLTVTSHGKASVLIGG